MGVDLKKCFGLIREPTEDEQRSFGFPSACDFQQVENRQEATPVPPSLSYCQHFSRPFFDSDRCSVPPESSSTGRDSPLQQSPIGVGTGGGGGPSGAPLLNSTKYFFYIEFTSGSGALEKESGVGATFDFEGDTATWTDRPEGGGYAVDVDGLWAGIDFLPFGSDVWRPMIFPHTLDPITDVEKMGHTFTTPDFSPDDPGTVTQIRISLRPSALGGGSIKLLFGQGNILTPGGPSGPVTHESPSLPVPGSETVVVFPLDEL